MRVFAFFVAANNEMDDVFVPSKAMDRCVRVVSCLSRGKFVFRHYC